MLPIIIVSSNQNHQNKFLDNLFKNQNIKKINIQDIDTEKAFSIEDVRNIKKTIFLKTFSGEKKAVIIHNFNLASSEAQNSMLKILEEPPSNTQIILLSENENLLPTIISRCKLVKLEQTKVIDENIFSQFKTIMQENLPEKFYFIQTVSKDKKELLNWISKLSYVIIKEGKNKNAKQLKDYFKIIKNLNNSYYQISNTNVSPRFVLENLFLELEDIIL